MLLRTLVTGILLTAGAFAQMSSFPKPSYFRETFQATQTKVELRDPVRLKDFVVDGKLELSLKHFLELVMANNTDIQLQLLSLEIPKANILSAFGAWDPTARASFSTTRTTGLPTSALQALDASSVTKSLTQPYSLSYGQTLETGTSLFGELSGAKTSQTNSFANYNPSLTSNLNFSVTQPLIKNRGVYVNKLPLMSAQSNYKVSEYNLRSQLLTLVNTAESAYWNVISARENLRVQEKNRDTANEYLKYMQKQLDLGAISPLDIYNPQQSLAAADLSVSQAKFNLKAAEDTLRHQLGVDLDPEVRKLPLSLTETRGLGALRFPGRGHGAVGSQSPVHQPYHRLRRSEAGRRRPGHSVRAQRPAAEPFVDRAIYRQRARRHLLSERQHLDRRRSVRRDSRRNRGCAGSDVQFRISDLPGRASP